MSGKARKIWLLPLTLAAVTLCTSALLMISHTMTKERIAEQQLQAKLASLKQLIPADLIDNDLVADAQEIFKPEDLGHREPETLYIGKQQGQVVVMAVPVIARNGYSGDIKLMVGIRNDGTITAVAIIAHKETPGLGDLIEPNKSDWLQQFPGKSLDNPEAAQWRVKKDQGYFDQITAATITPRAVVAAIKKALEFHQQWLQQQETENE